MVAITLRAKRLGVEPGGFWGALFAAAWIIMVVSIFAPDILRIAHPRYVGVETVEGMSGQVYRIDDPELLVAERERLQYLLDDARTNNDTSRMQSLAEAMSHIGEGGEPITEDLIVISICSGSQEPRWVLSHLQA